MSKNTWIIAVIVVIVIVVGVYYVFYNKPYGTGTPTAPSAPVAPGAVTIKNFSFNPATITVGTGTTVSWTNEDSAVHQIASDTNVFNSLNLSQGQTFQFTFTTAGTYAYHCAIHPSMKGTVVVR